MNLLLVSGSTRAGSTNTAALAAARHVAPTHVTSVLYDALAGLPAFDPGSDVEPLDPVVAGLRRLIAWSDAILFCAPEYAGTLPGSFKNLLDWTVGGGEIYGKAVAWINVAAEGRGAGAESSLATVLGYVGADIVWAACSRVTVPRDAVDARGEVTDGAIRRQIAAVVSALLDRNRHVTDEETPVHQAPLWLRPIGRVQSSLVEPAGAPKQGREGAPEAVVVFRSDVAEGLGDVTPGSDYVLVTWLDRPAGPVEGAPARRGRRSAAGCLRHPVGRPAQPDRPAPGHSPEPRGLEASRATARSRRWNAGTRPEAGTGRTARPLSTHVRTPLPEKGLTLTRRQSVRSGQPAGRRRSKGRDGR